jgi:hypothetical protein
MYSPLTICESLVLITFCSCGELIPEGLGCLMVEDGLFNICSVRKYKVKMSSTGVS